MNGLGTLLKVPSQILTVFQHEHNKTPIHIDLDSGATVNYCTESEALQRGFTIYPNGQMSKLGDGETKLKGIGEINETFMRNNWRSLHTSLRGMRSSWRQSSRGMKIVLTHFSVKVQILITKMKKEETQQVIMLPGRVTMVF